jgi:hypothetical protein
MLLHAGQTSLEIVPPTGDVQIQQAVVVLGEKLVDQVINRFQTRAILRTLNSHGVEGTVGVWVRVKWRRKFRCKGRT